MNRARWIKLYEGIKESAVWSDPLRLKAWIDILIRANYKDKEWFHNGQVVRVKRGQFVTSIRKLAEEWKCSPNTARRILDQFAELHMLERDSGTGKYTLVTVVKYKDFQDSTLPDGYTDEYTDEHIDEHTDGYTDEHIDGRQHKNIKKDKKDKKGKKPAAPMGAPEYGEPPAGWDDECEKQFLKDKPYNPNQTRAEWWDFWKE